MQVAIIEDDPVIARAVGTAIREAGHECTWVADGDTAIRDQTLAVNDLVVLDLLLPGAAGLEVLTSARAAGIRTPVIVLTALGTVPDKLRGFAEGADDYLVKPFAMEELLARMQALLRRRPDLARVAVDIGPLRIDPQKRQAWMDGRELDLTAREFELLESLARHAGMVLSRTQLLEQVWGYTFDVQTNVVDVFIGYLRRKLEAQGEERIIHTVRGHGFVIRA